MSNNFNNKQQELVGQFSEILKFGSDLFRNSELNFTRVRFKKQLLFLTVCASQSYSESIFKLLRSEPYFDKASEVIFRSLVETFININYVYAGRNQRNAFVFIIDSIQEQIDFAEKHKSFWNKYPKWNLTFGHIKSPNDWDQFISDRESEIKIILKKYKYKIPKKIPDIRGRAIAFDEYLKKKKKLSKRQSLEKYYVLYYKFFSQIAHLNISGLNRFFVTDENNQQRLSIDGSPDDAERVITITYQIYFVLLRFFAKEFKLYKKDDFLKFEKFSKSILKS